MLLYFRSVSVEAGGGLERRIASQGSTCDVMELRQHSLGVLDPNQIVCADRPLHRSFAQVLVLVLTQAGDGLQIEDNRGYWGGGGRRRGDAALDKRTSSFCARFLLSGSRGKLRLLSSASERRSK